MREPESARVGGVDAFAEVVDQEEVGFLAGGAAFAWHDELAGGEAPGFTTAATEEGDGLEAEFLRLGERGEDVAGVAARSERDDEVAGLGEAGDLAGEDVVVAVVVADAGEERAVAVERDGRERAAILLVAADEFGGEMLGLGRAAAVAADKEFVAALEAGENQVAGAIDRGTQAGEGLKRADGFGEGGFEGHATEENH